MKQRTQTSLGRPPPWPWLTVCDDNVLHQNCQRITLCGEHGGWKRLLNIEPLQTLIHHEWEKVRIVEDPLAATNG